MTDDVYSLYPSYEGTLYQLWNEIGRWDYRLNFYGLYDKFRGYDRSNNLMGDVSGKYLVRRLLPERSYVVFQLLPGRKSRFKPIPKTRKAPSIPTVSFKEQFVWTNKATGVKSYGTGSIAVVQQQQSTNTKSSNNVPPIRLPEGVFPTKAYTRVSDLSLSDQFTLITESTSQIEERLTCGIRLCDIPPLPSSSFLEGKLGGIATNRALSSLKGMKVNLGAAIGEGGQTLSLILTSVKRLAQSANFLKRGDIPNAVRALGSYGKSINIVALGKKHKSDKLSFSALWLELQYGWKPLISDVYELVDYLGQQPKIGLFRVTGSASDFVDAKSIGSGLNSIQIDRYMKLEVKARVMLWATVSNQRLYTASQLGLLNPASIAWELTPFSFIVDWFLPIGKFLDNLDAGAGITLVDGSQSLTVVGTGYCKPISKVGVSYSGDSSVERRYLKYTRSRLTSVPLPSFPWFKNPISTDHFLNSLALLRQFSKGR